MGKGEAIKQIVADFEKAGYLTDLQAGPSVRTAETFIAGLHGTTGGYRSIVWRCVSRVEKKKSGIDCPARTLREEDLQAAVVTAVNDAWSRKDSVLAVLEENVCSVINGGIKDKVAEVDKAIRDKQEEFLEAGSDQSLIEDIGDAIINLREERQSILTEAALKHDLQERIEDLISFLDEQTEAVTEYSEPLARRLIEKITVYDEKLVVEFKSGLTVEVEA